MYKSLDLLFFKFNEFQTFIGFKVQGDMKYVPMYVGPFFRHQNGKGNSTPVVSNL